MKSFLKKSLGINKEKKLMYYFTNSLINGYNHLINFFDKDTKLKIYFLEREKTIFYYTDMKLSNLQNIFSSPEVEFYLIEIQENIELKKITYFKEVPLCELFFQIYPENKYSLYSNNLTDDDLNKIINLIKEKAKINVQAFNDFNKGFEVLNKIIKNEIYKKFLTEFENSEIGKELNFSLKHPLYIQVLQNNIKNKLIEVLYHRFLHRIFLEGKAKILENFLSLITFISRPIEYITNKDIENILQINFDLEKEINDFHDQNFSYLKEKLILKKEFLFHLAKVKVCNFIEKNQDFNIEKLKKSSEFNDIKNFRKRYLEDKYGNTYSYELLRLISKFSEIKEKNEIQLLNIESEEYNDEIKNFCFNDLQRVGLYYRYLMKIYFNKNFKKKVSYKISSGERVPELENLENILENNEVSYVEKDNIRLLHFKIEEFRQFYYYEKNKLEILKRRFFEQKSINGFLMDSSMYLENHKIKSLKYYDEDIEILKEYFYYVIFKGDEKYFGKYLKSIILEDKNEILLFYMANGEIVNFYRNEIEVYSVKQIEFLIEDGKLQNNNQSNTNLL